MSGIVPNAAKPIGERLNEGLKQIAGLKNREDSSKAEVALDFLNHLIKQDGAPAAADILATAKSIINENFDSQKGLGQALLGMVSKASDIHVNKAEHGLPHSMIRELKPMRNVISHLGDSIDKLSGDHEARDGANLNGAKNSFFHGLTQINKEMSSVAEEDKPAYFDEKLKALVETTTNTYGKDVSQNLVASLEHMIAPVELAEALSQSEFGIQILDLKDGTEEKAYFDSFVKGDVTGLSQEDIVTVRKFANAALEGKDMSIPHHELSSKQKAYLEYLRQGADQLKKNAFSLEGILDKIGEYLPGLAMPGIIGLAVGHLMGGMGVMGAIGAVVVSLLGKEAAGDMVNEDGELVLDKEAKKPAPKLSIPNLGASNSSSTETVV